MEALRATVVDLPAFSTLDRLVASVRAEVHQRICNGVAARLAPEQAAVLETLLAKPPSALRQGSTA